MRENPVYVAYARSLIWTGLLIAISGSVTVVVGFTLFIFTHATSSRSLAYAFATIVAVPPFFAVVTLIGVLLIFTLTQSLQAVAADALIRRFGRRSQFAILLALPVTTVLTWYCYDYLTPSDLNLAINVPDDWVPYQHGISTKRYLSMLVAQTLVTLFSLFYCDATVRHTSRKWVVLTALVLAIAVGSVRGYFMVGDIRDSDTAARLD